MDWIVVPKLLVVQAERVDALSVDERAVHTVLAVYKVDKFA